MDDAARELERRDLERSAEEGDVEPVRKWVEELEARDARGAEADHLREGIGRALSAAARFGHAECVRWLLRVSGPLESDSLLLTTVAWRGHAECVRLLIPVSDPLAGRSRALSHAAYRGEEECVRLLIPVSDPRDQNSLALSRAARGGFLACVELLIPVSDPLADGSWALREAAQCGHEDCVRALLPVSDPLARDGSGRACAESARAAGREEVAELIEGWLASRADVKALEGELPGSGSAGRSVRRV